MNIVVIGAGGMLGYTTFRYLQQQGRSVIGITKTKADEDLIRLDATDEKAMGQFLYDQTIDVIINCAALLVDASERHKSEAVKLNVWLPHFLEEYCTNRGVYLIHASTDGVFSGKFGKYPENGQSDVNSFYGKSKYLGEVCGATSLTIRSGFWGADANASGQGLFHWFMQQDKRVFGYTGALFNGVSNLEFAKFVESAIQNRWTGIYHLCAARPISKYDFLTMQNRVFARNIEVHRNDTIHIDRTLINTRNDIFYEPKDYVQMMIELKDWISDNECFSHYFNGRVQK